MSEIQLQQEVKKAIDFYLDKTYELTDLCSHLLQIIRNNSSSGSRHIIHLECLIYKVQELRHNQQLFYNGHKSKLPVCKAQELEIDKRIQYLLSTAGYSIARFKNQLTQYSLFK